MAWTTPGTAVAGEVLTAAFWNEQVRDNIAELNDHTLLIGSATTAQSSVVNTDVTYDAATITVTPGRWLLLAGLSLTGSAADAVAVGVWNNTTSALVTDSTGNFFQHLGASQPFWGMSRPVLVTVTANTVFRPRARRNGGSIVTVTAVPAGLTTASSGYIAALRIGA
jgi:hypothetical protein